MSVTWESDRLGLGVERNTQDTLLRTVNEVGYDCGPETPEV